MRPSVPKIKDASLCNGSRNAPGGLAGGLPEVLAHVCLVGEAAPECYVSQTRILTSITHAIAAPFLRETA
jgi:hypothetical protein